MIYFGASIWIKNQGRLTPIFASIRKANSTLEVVSLERVKLGHLRVFTPTLYPVISFLALSLVDDDLFDICWFVGLISLFSPPMDYMIYDLSVLSHSSLGRVFYHVWWDVDSYVLCTFVYAFPCFLYFEKLQKDFPFYQGKFAMCFVLFLLWI